MGRWPEDDVKRKKYDPRVHPFRYEKDFQDWLLKVARRLGYNAYHTFKSKHSEAGYPDTTICGKGRLIYAELKTPWNPNPSDEQKRWLDALALVRDTNISVSGGPEKPEVYLWRADKATLDAILEVLNG